ncbi:MAG: bifunctional folylpolyglutamate synthase/dihydrofolate synthase, partial [Nitrospirae bacterium]
MGCADSFLAGLAPARMVFDLDAFARLLARLGDPQAAVPALHVAGTNGKGSVCAVAEAVLRAHGERTGLYTSPHLDHPRERIAVGGRPLSEAAFEAAVEGLARRLAQVAPGLPYSYFDFLTALAFTLFAEEGLSAAVVETGLGGRLDSTRLCHPRATCLTPIARDHTAVLGHDLAAIAREKAGILRPGVPCACASQPPEAAAALAAAAREVGAPLLLFGEDFAAEAGAAGLRYRPLRGPELELPLPLPGRHQVVNTACALASCELFLDRPLEPEATRRALSSVHWPGRLERLGGVLLDGAHNRAGARALGEYLRTCPRPLWLVWGMLEHKDPEGFVAALGVAPAEV